MNKFLVVKLDQYAGNVDELVCVALTGWGADRYGHEQARAVFDNKVKPLLDGPDDEYPDLPVEFFEFNTDHGTMPYELDSAYSNSLRLCIDSHTTNTMLDEMLDIWERAYGNDDGALTITVDDIHSRQVEVKVLGFDLVEVVENRRMIR